VKHADVLNAIVTFRYKKVWLPKVELRLEKKVFTEGKPYKGMFHYRHQDELGVLAWVVQRPACLRNFSPDAVTHINRFFSEEKATK